MTLRIRLITIGDCEALAELQVSKRDFLSPWDPARGDDYFTVEGQRADVEAALARHDGRVVGCLTLSSIIRGPFQSCSMGTGCQRIRRAKAWRRRRSVQQSPTPTTS
jgi:[ribosomal protein S5]-alanine N-acetyltransferase